MPSTSPITASSTADPSSPAAVRNARTSSSELGRETVKEALRASAIATTASRSCTFGATDATPQAAVPAARTRTAPPMTARDGLMRASTVRGRRPPACGSCRVERHRGVPLRACHPRVATRSPAVRTVPAAGSPSLPRVRQLLRFAWIEAQCCLFAVLFFLGLGLVRVVPLPIDAADALLLWCLAVTLVLWLVRWETGREVAVIFGFHLVGLALELYKVRQGSWSYPDTGHAAIGGGLALNRVLVPAPRRPLCLLRWRCRPRG